MIVRLNLCPICKKASRETTPVKKWYIIEMNCQKSAARAVISTAEENQKNDNPFAAIAGIITTTSTIAKTA